MSKLHIFEPGERSIDKDSASKLRENILTKAKNDNVVINPVHFEDLLRAVKRVMIRLSSDYEFQFEGREVDFSKDNPVMFTSRVLKRLFSNDINKESIVIQSKNLDILSYYAFNKCWNEVVSENNMVSDEEGKENAKAVKKLITIFNRILTKKNIKKSILIFTYIVFITAIIFLILKINDLNKKILILDLNHKNLQEEFEWKYNKYQSTLRWYNKYLYLYKNIDVKYYDTLKIPDLKRIFIMQFTTNPTYKFKDNINVEVLKSKNKFKNEPGIKDCDKFGGTKAFGFGRTYCKTNCYEPFEKVPYWQQPNCVIFRINFHDTTDITCISFQWIETGGNWGSSGNVFINGKKVGVEPYQYIGNWPNSNLLKDETVRNFKCKVEERASYIDIVVQDISDESEIFIDNIDVYGK